MSLNCPLVEATEAGTMEAPARHEQLGMNSGSTPEANSLTLGSARGAP